MSNTWIVYLQKADFLCDFLQREVAEYGDSDGTRTNKAKSTAENKLAKYYMKLGKAMAQKNVKKWFIFTHESLDLS